MAPSPSEQILISLTVQTLGGQSIPLAVPAQCRVVDVGDRLHQTKDLPASQSLKLSFGTAVLGPRGYSKSV